MDERSKVILVGPTEKASEYTIIPGGSHATPAENPEMMNLVIDLRLRTHFHELVEERAPAPARAPRKKPATK
jgi:hypothetical protein